jgi:hypothetical protein
MATLTKLRVIVPSSNGEPRMLSGPCDVLEALCAVRCFRRNNVVANILPDSRSLRTLEANAEERGVLRFNPIINGICPCGCGQLAVNIAFPPKIFGSLEEAEAYGAKAAAQFADVCAIAVPVESEPSPPAPSVSPETSEPAIAAVPDPPRPPSSPLSLLGQAIDVVMTWLLTIHF